MLTRFKSPDTLLILAMVLLLVTMLTWVVSPGEFERTTSNGIEILVPDSYKLVAPSPQGFSEFLTAPLRGFREGALIIGFVLIVGGAFNLLTHTKAIDAGLQSVITKSLRRPRYKRVIIPLIMVLFSAAGATFGMSEEVLFFILISIPFARAMGYDTIVGVAIPFISAGAGFAGAVTNPFTIGIAQAISGLAPFSGWEYRIVVWLMLTSAAIIYVMRYANRIETDVSTSPEFATGETIALTPRRITVLVLFLSAIVVLMIGSTQWGWYIPEITALFIVLGICAAIIGRIPANKAVEVFLEGSKSMLGAALVIAMAKGILIVASEGKVIDTILFQLTALMNGMSPLVSAQVMFAVQNVINFFVPSGSGQAALTMPVMGPLSDLLHITRQTCVLIFQLGDGIGNMIIPTSGVTMGVLSAAGIPYVRWVKWVWPLIAILFVLSMILLIPPVVFFNWQ